VDASTLEPATDQGVLDHDTYDAIREPRSAGRLPLGDGTWHQWWAWIPGGVFLGILVWTMIITPRQARAYGYQLRDDDLVFRRGILWQRVVAVPYGRMQLIDITHGPLDRGFGIAQLKFVTAAAATGVVIPGLAQSTAETLRDHLIEVAESRRTGL
jgi:membrane protein YdbS with pleckstrin-like domain